MIRLENHLGVTEISHDYFANLIGKVSSECFGVSGMMVSSPAQGLRSFLKKDGMDKGVRVRNIGGKLIVDLHISVMYGVNISAIVKSIVNKVRYTIEDATGLAVSKVNVYVDSMKTE